MQDTRERSEVAIVGAGPAGAWAAYRLARRGVRVTIFDSSHPREKPCGGGVTGRALALASEAIDTARLPARTISHARFTDANGQHDISMPLDKDESGRALVVVSRTDFDAALLSAAQDAGARLVRGARDRYFGRIERCDDPDNQGTLRRGVRHRRGWRQQPGSAAFGAAVPPR